MHHIFCRREIQLLERHLAVILGMVYFKKKFLNAHFCIPNILDDL